MKKFKIIIGILILVVLIVAVSIILYMRSFARGRILDASDVPSDTDCILVLGAGVKPDGSPSIMLRDRLHMGVALYKDKKSPKLIMSGDHGTKGYDEVNTMKGYALSNGVPSEDCFMDHAGFSTYESLYRARDVFGVKKVIIVSQRYHLYRAIYIARKLGLDAYGVSADTMRYGGQTYRDVRELAAYCKDFFWCLTNVKPKFLGDAIPVSGNGDVTND